MIELIQNIALKNKEEGFKFNSPLTVSEIKEFEGKIGFVIPQEFKDFYKLCNGFECEEDQFRILELSEIISDKWHRGKNWFYFSEYLLFCDMWGVKVITENKFEIFNSSNNNILLTTSLTEFLEVFLKGNVFEKDGLYDWMETKGIKS